ncbi:hypothetical protein V6N13_014971 [Hibiscus sabdariffa]
MLITVFCHIKHVLIDDILYAISCFPDMLHPCLYTFIASFSGGPASASLKKEERNSSSCFMSATSIWKSFSSCISSLRKEINFSSTMFTATSAISTGFLRDTEIARI